MTPPVVLGLLLGTLAFLSPGSIFIGFSVLVVCLLIRRGSHPQEKRFLLALFLVGFFVRAFVSLTLDGVAWKVQGERPTKRGPVQGWNLNIVDGTREYLKMGDSDYFSQRGYATAQYVQGVLEPVVPFRMNQYGWHGYVYVIGLFYHLFDYSPSAVKLINCLLGALLGPFTFFLARACFNRWVARGAGLAVAFFPSLVLWSASNLKDIPLTFLTLLLLLLFVKIQQVHRIRSIAWYGLAFLLTWYAHTTLRTSMISLALLGCLLGSYLIARWTPKKWVLILALGIGVGLLYVEPVAVQVRRGLGQALNKHIGYVGTLGTSYRVLPKEYYSPRYVWEWMESGRVDPPLLMGLTKGVLHYLLEPFPWRMENLLQRLAFPQMIFWYFSLLFALLGVLGSLRCGFRKILFLLSTLVVWVFLGALPSGNVGTVFRIRDMVTPLILIFASAGAWVFLRGSKGLPA